LYVYDGFDRCTTAVVTLPCDIFSGGLPNNGACCTGGSFWSVHPTVTKAVERKTPVGECWFIHPVPADD